TAANPSASDPVPRLPRKEIQYHASELPRGWPMAGELRLHTIVSMPFEENSYLLGLPERTDVLVIDPGFQPESILEHLEGEGLTVAAILNTHGHADHIAGNS